MSALPSSEINQPAGTSADWTRGYRWALAGAGEPTGRPVSKSKRQMFMRGFEAGRADLENCRLRFAKYSHIAELLAA